MENKVAEDEGACNQVHGAAWLNGQPGESMEIQK